MGAGMRIDPVVTDTDNSNDVARISEDGKTWFLKRYRGEGAISRRDTERDRLRLWRDKGFPVPRVVAKSLPREPGPHLVLEWVEGVSLAGFLKDGARSIDSRLGTLEAVIKCFHDRQEVNEGLEDFELIHSDPNTGNILVIEGGFFYIDLESRVTRAYRDFNEALAVELAKFLRWAVRDLGRQYLDRVVSFVLDSYGRESLIIAALVDRVYRVPFQFVHRWRDRRKKAGRPGEVTKYDLADAFHAKLG